MFKDKMSSMFFQMMYLKNKSHLSSSQASRLAIESSLFSNGTLDTFMRGESLSNTEKLKQERDQEVTASKEIQTAISTINNQSAIDIDHIKSIGSIKSRLLIGKMLGKSISELGLEGAEATAKKLAGGDDLSRLSDKEIIKHF